MKQNRTIFFTKLTLMPLLVLALGVSFLDTNAQEESCQYGSCGNTGTFDFFYSIQTGFEDFRELITINPAVKAQIKLEHSINAQERADKLFNEGREVPDEIVQRAEVKVKEAETIANNNRLVIMEKVKDDQDDKITNDVRIINAIDDSLYKIRYNAEIIKVRPIVLDFEELRVDYKNGLITDEQARVHTDRIDDDINSIEIVDANCEKRIDSFSLLQSDDPYEDVEDFCSKAKSYDLRELKRTLLLISD